MAWASVNNAQFSEAEQCCCSKKCQKEHWKLGHKLYCKQDPNRPVAEPLTETVLESARRQGFMPLQMQAPGGSYVP